MHNKKLPPHHEFQRWIKLFFRIILFCVCFFFLQYGLAQRSETKRDTYTFKSLQVHNNTWGYDIYVNDKLKIHQPHIPCKPGNEGFKSKEAAAKVAELVIEKMKKGEMPPTVTEEELKKLEI